ncbi:MAG: zinc-dependent metalloprotease [Bacteroidales bacterium]|nr:zinc-dependent metalloprotease [Bacteroidales bacterium]MDD4669527.1 zinc-dependent metalloprotease [Bacteroidales bacterium]
MKQFLLILLTGLLIFSPVQMDAQRKNKRQAQKSEQTATPADSTKKQAPKGPVSIEKFLKKDASKMEGMTTVYKQDDKYYFAIPDSLFGKELLLVSRVSKSAAGMRGSFSGYAGDQINEGLFRFEKGPNNKIFLRSVFTRERSLSEDRPMYRNLQNSNLNAIVGSFDIKAWNNEKNLFIIDVTDFFMADSELFYFSKRGKSSFKLGGQDKEKSYIESIKTYPINTEVKVVKTFAKQESAGTATFEFNCSFVMLPEVPMTPRYYDERVGYFTANYTDFDKNPQGVESVKMITRWRLEPKPEDIEKYKRGELVEPVKPIVFYIDPTTPKKWVPYLIQGVNDWQPLFEKAGFKNAIYALEAPTAEEDPTWSLDDARHSAIVYKPSDIPNASGPHVHDPRSGEIIESHVNWYHNVMSLLRNWYFIQCSPVDTAARKMVFDDELMGQLIRFVSSHEVGHTLGLRHNFAGSAQFTVEQLRDPKFLAEHGHTTSIMDYSRFNFVAQPGDNIPRECLFPRLGTYDFWAIEWGYRRFLDIEDPDKELSMLNKWVIDKTKDPLYFFGTESSPSDPRYQSEDLGSNQMETCSLGIKNLQFIMDHLIEWTSEPNKDYSNLKILHNEVISQYRRYIGHVAKWVGGVYETPKTVEMEGDIYTPVPKERQVEAMNFLNKYVFQPQEWLVPDDIMNKLVSKPELVLDNTYKSVFSALLVKRVMLNLYEAELQNGSKAYTMNDLFKDLNKNVWGNLASGKTANPYQRLLQKSYTNALCGLFTGETSIMRPGVSMAKDNTDIVSTIYYQLTDLQKRLKSSPATDITTKAHNAYLVKVIDQAIEDGLKGSKK